MKIKQVTWKQFELPVGQLSGFLTAQNFQPGKFIVVNKFPGAAIVIYVDEEK